MRAIIRSIEIVVLTITMAFALLAVGAGILITQKPDETEKVVCTLMTENILDYTSCRLQLDI